jgi:hypothetical protein
LKLIKLLLIAAVLPSHAVGQTLTELRQQVDSAAKVTPFDYPAYSRATEKARMRVYELIMQDQLQTAADFFTASQLASDPTGFYESRRVEHELALVSLVLGHPEAIKRVAFSWDGLNLSIGRGQRIGSYKRNNVPDNMDPVPAPTVVRNVFVDLAGARARAATAKINASTLSSSKFEMRIRLTAKAT